MRSERHMSGVRRRGVAGLMSLLAAVVVLVLSTQPVLAQGPRQLQWWLDALQIPSADRLSTGRNVTVAVLDTGVDGSNPAFSGRLLPGVDLDDPEGSAYTDTYGHGTAMAGIIAASGAGDGPMGVAPDATILPVRVAKDERGDKDFLVPIAIKYAVDQGAKVINISLGGPGVAPTDMKQALQYAFQHDAVVVAAVGNVVNGDHGVTVPADYPGVVAVTGTNRSETFWTGSIQGPEAVLSAPAEDIVSTQSAQVGSEPYRAADGTSDSAAIVSGVAGLIRSKYPKLDAANVINRLIRTAGDKGPVGRDPQYGFGVVDPVKALTAEVAPVDQNPLVAPAGGSPNGGSGSGASRAAPAEGSGGSGMVAVVLVVVAVVLVGVVVGLVWWRRRRVVSWSGAMGSGGRGEGGGG